MNPAPPLAPAPPTAPQPLRRPLVLVSWDGRAPALACIEVDARPEFDLVVFDYSGTQTPGSTEVGGLHAQVLAGRTECKGDIYQALACHLAGQPVPEYVGLIDDDVWLSISAINRCLHLARSGPWDVVSPTLSHDSQFSHRWMLRQSHRVFREVDWVEVMAPFYRGDLFLACAPFMQGYVSSWGFDSALIPTLQQLRGQTRTALLDAVMMAHFRPVSSGGKRFRNGRTAAQEMAALRAQCVALIAREQPALQHTAWFHRLFVRRHAQPRWARWARALGRHLRRWLDQST